MSKTATDSHNDEAVHGEITRVLRDVADKTPGAIDQLIALVGAEMRQRAGKHLANSPPWKTLQPTALVNEVYLRFFGKDATPEWHDRGHFFMAASRAMRDIIVERARKATSIKAGGDHNRVPLDTNACRLDQSRRIIELDDAIESLSKVQPEYADIVRLHFFLELPMEEIAEVMNVSKRTVFRKWAAARAWLIEKLGDDFPAATPV